MSLFIAALLLSAQAPAAQPATNPAQAPAATAPGSKPKKVCRLEDGDSASRMSKRVCRTVDDWNRQAQSGESHSGMSLSGEAMQSH